MKIFTFYFKQGLLRFCKYNPHFGKVRADLVYKMDENNITKFLCVKSFEDKHIPFNNIERQNILLHIVNKRNDGLLTQRKYAQKELMLSLVRIANDLDNKNR